MSALVIGEGRLADRVRGAAVGDVPCAVIVVGVDGRVGAVPVETMSDALIDTVFEQPMRRLIEALQQSHASGSRRIVVVVPTSGMSGAAMHAVHAALAEAAHVLVKSAARQWGSQGITVNTVAVDPAWFDIDPAVSGPVSIAPRAIPGDVDPIGAIAWLCGAASGDVTGQTIVCDGGLWM